MTRRVAMLMLARLAKRPERSILQVEIRTGYLLENDWQNPDKPVPGGSLLKPFVALAYGASHGFAFPEFTCKRCWKAEGHGRINFTQAVAYSCNAYFLELARVCPADEVARVATDYGLSAPLSNDPHAWIGLGDGWQVSPFSLVRAYCELALRRTQPGPAAILKGMRSSARYGTARAIGVDVFAKTGTASCSHHPRGNGDGLAAALFPADSPRRAILVGMHDRPGSEAARAAGELIAAEGLGPGTHTRASYK